MMDWFNSKHVAKAYEREYELCFDWRFILSSFVFILLSFALEYSVIYFIPFMTKFIYEKTLYLYWRLVL
jgi:hypothetical protein